MILKVDADVCQGFGNCVMAAPDLFDLDDNDLAVILRADVPDSERSHVEEAVRSCPVRAIEIVS